MRKTANRGASGRDQKREARPRQRARSSRSDSHELFDAFEAQDFSWSTCFLCGARLLEANRSDEHVFAKWLLNRFKLHDTKLTLTNGTDIPYRQLTIPCCKTCNNVHLSKLENAVQAVVEGTTPLHELEDETLYLWTSKIFYGLLFREVLLPMDRRRPSDGSIISPDDIARYRMLQVFLQAARVPVRFQSIDAPFPASVFAYKVQEPVNPALRFDFRDDINSMCVYLRLGTIGIIAAFDGGAQAFEMRRLFLKFRRNRLHPLQFEELGAVLFCKGTLFDRTPKLIISGDLKCGYEIFVMPIAGMSLRPVFAAWDEERYHQFLAMFTGLAPEQVSPSPGHTWTFLRGAGSARFKAIDIKRHPYGNAA